MSDRPITKFTHVLNALKHTRRQGYVDYCVRRPETVWEHCRSTAYDGLAHARRLRKLLPVGFTPEACFPLGLYHDFTEALVVDATPRTGISKAQKNWLENTAIEHIGSMGKAGEMAKYFWLRFENDNTPEVQFMHREDALQIAKRCLHYERNNRSPYTLRHFWNYVGAKLDGHPLEVIYHELQAARPAGADDKPELPIGNSLMLSFEQAATQMFARMGKPMPKTLPALT